MTGSLWVDLLRQVNSRFGSPVRAILAGLGLDATSLFDENPAQAAKPA
jgi:hypothetical protein